MGTNYASAFQRENDMDDESFYRKPLYLNFLDKEARTALTDYYRTVFRQLPSNRSHLDLCCSWVSFLPEDHVAECKTVFGIGMNEEELQNNKQLTSFAVHDLNKNPTLPFENSTFDVVTNVVSI